MVKFDGEHIALKKKLGLRNPESENSGVPVS
jgi:hypothetical protein